MQKTLLLCFIHGFKGDDNTFGGFPQQLRALVSHALPSIRVATVTYPTFETRGDLAECMGRFRDWYAAFPPRYAPGGLYTVEQSDEIGISPRLVNKVIDLEVAAGTPSPTVDPSVRTILLGHSMGGIVAAETLLALHADLPVSSSQQASEFMFPSIIGILAFDTPYLGIAPSVIAYGAEGHYNTASTAYTQLSGLAGGLWGAGAASSSTAATPPAGLTSDKSNKGFGDSGGPPLGTLAGKDAGGTDSGASMSKKAEDTAAPAWQRWGKIAMYAGAAGAVAAGGATAYLKRDQISGSWGWIGSHLEFVGCLARGEELKQRLQRVIDLENEGLVGFADLVTVLGKAARADGGVLARATVSTGERTFCNLPLAQSGNRRYFHCTINDAAKDETWAHMSMFIPKENPGYYQMSEQAKAFVTAWATTAMHLEQTELGASSS